eukprot:3936128-Rhodomonas_salina.1
MRGLCASATRRARSTASMLSRMLSCRMPINSFAPSRIALPSGPDCAAFRCTASAPTHAMRYFVNDLRSPKFTVRG